MMSQARSKKWQSRALWRYFLLLACGVLLVLLFGSNLISYAQKRLDGISLLQFNSTIPNDIGFGAIGILLSLAFCIKRIRIPLPVGIAALLGISLWVIARVTSEYHVFAFYKHIPLIAYADSFILPVVVLLAGNLRYPGSRNAGQHTPDKTAVADVPVARREEDEFGFMSIVADVASFIRRNRPKATRTIGVHGAWGAGKTSFLNLVRGELKDATSRVRFVDFTPWHNSEESFTTQLLSKLIEALDPNEHALRQDLKKYSAVLQEYSFVRKTLKWFTAPDQLSPTSLRETINKRLTASNLTYVVVIDDLDRLSGKEMTEVLKLIRSTADFHGLYYLLAYDRTEVNNALSFEGISNSKYFDKFVELEIGLPLVTPRQLGDFLLNHLDLVADETNKKALKDSLFGHTGERFEYAAFVSTPRDAKRLALSVNVFYHRVQRDIDLHDAVLVQMLRMRFPAQLELFARDFKRFLVHEDSPQFRKRLILKKEEHKATIDNAIDAEEAAGRLKTDEKNHFLKILRLLFPEHNHFGDTEGFNRVYYTDSFHRYFTYYIDGRSLSEDEFDAIMTGNESAENIAQRVLGKGQELSLCMRMEYAANRDNRWRVIEILLALGRESSSIDRSNDWHIPLGSHTGWLRDQLTRRHFTDGNQPVPVEAANKFTNLLERGNYPFLFERILLHHLYGEFTSNGFIISREDIKACMLNYIDVVLQREVTWNRVVSRALADCYVREWIETGVNTHRENNVWLPETKQLLDKARERFGSNPYCSWFLKSNHFPDDEGQYAIHQVAKDVYGSWDGFKQHLESLQPDPAITELLDLYRQFADGGFNNWIAFKPTVLSRLPLEQ